MNRTSIEFYISVFLRLVKTPSGTRLISSGIDLFSKMKQFADPHIDPIRVACNSVIPPTTQYYTHSATEAGIPLLHDAIGCAKPLSLLSTEDVLSMKQYWTTKVTNCFLFLSKQHYGITVS